MTNHAFEVAHDTELLRLYTLVAHADRAVAVAANRIWNTVCNVHVGLRGDATVRTPGEYGSKRVKVADLPDDTLYYQAQTYTKGEEGYWITTPTGRERAVFTDALARITEDDPALAAWAEAEANRDDALDDVMTHEEGYTGWARFWLVTSSPGHVHASTNCTSCYFTTRYAPVPALAAHTEAEAVELLGPTLCTVCFPTAPTEDTGAKITEAMAATLLNDGEDAFLAKLDAAKAKADTKCTNKTPEPGTGNGPQAYRRYATCGTCGARGVSVTTAGNLRAHKKGPVR